MSFYQPKTDLGVLLDLSGKFSALKGKSKSSQVAHSCWKNAIVRKAEASSPCIPHTVARLKLGAFGVVDCVMPAPYLHFVITPGES